MAKMIPVADDDPLIRTMLCELFEQEADYDICAEASNGQEAIELALKHRPDLIILDFRMPVLNGLGVLLNDSEPRFFVERHHVHGIRSPGTFLVKRFENSRSIFPPIRPARPTAALVKTRLAPRFALG
jgi:DNA-binding LytR/AlgR family response regulator